MSRASAMSSVKNRIASFEAHNEELRQASSPKKSPKTPPVVSPVSPQQHSSSSFDSPVHRPLTSSSSSTTRMIQQNNNNNDDCLSPERYPSTTAAASQSRVSRLQRQTGLRAPQPPCESPVPADDDAPATTSSTSMIQTRNKLAVASARRLMGIPDKNTGAAADDDDRRESGTPVALSKSTSGPTVSLFSHHKRSPTASSPTTSASPTSSSGGYGYNNRQPSGQGVANHSRSLNTNISSSSSSQQYRASPSVQNRASELSRRHMMQPRYFEQDGTHMNHVKQGVVNTDENEDDEEQPTATATTTRSSNMRYLGKIQRMKKIRQSRDHHRTGPSPSTTTTATNRSSDFAAAPPAMNNSSSTEHANDDEITLTSVRQIVESSAADNRTNDSSDKNHETQSSVSHAAAARAQNHQMWMQQGEEKKTEHEAAATPTNRRAIVMAPSSSSDYETDGDRSSRGPAQFHNPSTSASQLTADGVAAAFFDRKRKGHHDSSARSLNNKQDDDDNTYDYSGRDDANNTYNNYNLPTNTFESAMQDNNDDNDSQGSISYTRRMEKAAREEQARKEAAAAAKANMEGPFIKKEDMEDLQKKLDTPAVKTAVGVAAAATVGCVVLGPVGLLLGAAAVGIGAGVMQIPQEQRSNMGTRAAEAMTQATEAISNSCANTYRDSGIDEHVPQEMKSCCTAIEEEVTKATTASVVKDEDGLVEAKGIDKVQGADSQGKTSDGKEQVSPKPANRFRKKDKVACLREGQIIPVGQIHALDPSAQPRAWLDVLASAETSHDEKTEAMEEILILAKDKRRARIFLEEGILDSLMWTLGRYFEKLDHKNAADDGDNSNWANPEITSEEANATKLAATCCVTLGKSHCAAIHTGGDLLLMSMYERGTVPEERQLAQMLHEVPYHSRITKTDDPSVIDPSKEVFAVKQMSLPQAEELAQKIKAVADGQAAIV